MTVPVEPGLYPDSIPEIYGRSANWNSTFCNLLKVFSSTILSLSLSSKYSLLLFSPSPACAGAVLDSQPATFGHEHFYEKIKTGNG